MRLARTGPTWAFLGAFGASFVIASMSLTVLTVLLRWIVQLEQSVSDLRLPFMTTGIDVAVMWAVSFALAAAGAPIVVRAADGPIAALLYGATLLVGIVLYVARAVEAERTAIPSFTFFTLQSVPVTVVLTFAPAVVAFALTWRGASAAGASGTNAGLECAGAYALMAIAVLAIAPPYFDVLQGPYALVGLDATRHAAAVTAQSIVAGAVYGARASLPISVHALAVLVGLAFAAVLPTEIFPIWLTLFHDWSYVPLSLVLVPLGTVLVGLASAAVTRRAVGPRSGPPGPPHVPSMPGMTHGVSPS